MEGLGHRAELLAQADGLRGRDAQRHLRLVRAQAQQARAGRCRAEAARRAGDVPAAVVVLRVDHVAHPAGHVDADHHRVDDLAAAGAASTPPAPAPPSRPGPRDGLWSSGACRRNRSVCEVMPLISAALAISTRSRAAQDGGLFRRLEHLHRMQGRQGRFVVRGADGAAQPVHERCDGPRGRPRRSTRAKDDGRRIPPGCGSRAARCDRHRSWCSGPCVSLGWRCGKSVGGARPPAKGHASRLDVLRLRQLGPPLEILADVSGELGRRHRHGDDRLRCPAAWSAPGPSGLCSGR